MLTMSTMSLNAEKYDLSWKTKMVVFELLTYKVVQIVLSFEKYLVREKCKENE